MEKNGRHYVGIGEAEIITGEGVMRTILGSCVGLIVYDTTIPVGGMAHIMLPEPVLGKTTWSRFASTVVPRLTQELEKYGAQLKRMKAIVTGGASMFAFLSGRSNGIGAIGSRNTHVVIEELRKIGIPIVKKDIGGTSGRKVEFDIGVGECRISLMKKAL